MLPHWVLLQLTSYKQCYGYHEDTYVHYNTFHVAWCVMLPNDGHEIAETCRRYINYTVAYVQTLVV